MTPCASATVLESLASLRTKAKQIVLAWRSLIGLRVAQTNLRTEIHSMLLWHFSVFPLQHGPQFALR